MVDSENLKLQIIGLLRPLPGGVATFSLEAIIVGGGLKASPLVFIKKFLLMGIKSLRMIWLFTVSGYLCAQY